MLIVAIFSQECSARNGEFMFPYGTAAGDDDLASNKKHQLVSLPGNGMPFGGSETTDGIAVSSPIYHLSIEILLEQVKFTSFT